MKKQIPELQSLPMSNLDSNATKEAESFANDDLEKEAKINDHQRKELFKKHFSKAALIIFWIVVSGFIVMAIIWFYHQVTPGSLHFLNDSQTEKIQTFLFSAAIVKISKDYLSKHL